MKVAFYGNNLNCGFFFLRELEKHGHKTTLIYPDYKHEQDHPDWWTNSIDTNIELKKIPIRTTLGGIGRKLYPLKLDPRLRRVYNELNDYDLIFMMEDGPAIFQELSIPKIFISQGSDLQTMPFGVSLTLNEGLFKILRLSIQLFRNNLYIQGINSLIRRFGSLVLKYLSLPNAYMLQRRQRKGLMSCSFYVIQPYQKHLISSLKLDVKKVKFFPFLIDTKTMSEVDNTYTRELEVKYASYDTVFFHPTRQLYLKLNNDKYLKDNDKLIYAFAKFVKKSSKKSKLVLIEKGRDIEIANSKMLINQLKIKDYVEWLPEANHMKIRSFYLLPNVVVCDQFSPNGATLGSIGREASFFQKILITAFSKENSLLYTKMPQHIFGADSTDMILSAMEKIDSLQDKDFRKLKETAKEWCEFNVEGAAIIKKYIELAKSI